MKEYEFTFKFQLYQPDSDPADHLDALAAAGCTDAVVGVGRNGRIALTFNREHSSALEAISSAIEEVHTAIPDAKLIEVSPDYVGISDIADIFDFTRQNMLKLIQRGGPAFPSPIHEGRPSIWHLAEVLEWFQCDQHRQIQAELHEASNVAMQINLYREFARVSRAPVSAFRFDAHSKDSKLESVIGPVIGLQ